MCIRDQGTNIAITPSGSTLTVSAPDALTGVVHDATFTGNGTTLSPLSVVSAESQQEPFYAKGFSGDPSFTLTTVPMGKRLVIEHISGSCSVPIGDRVTEVQLFFQPMGSLFEQFHHLIPSFTGHSLTSDHYSWSQSVRFIVDSGAKVSLFVGKYPTSGDGCFASLAGYLVVKP